MSYLWDVLNKGCDLLEVTDADSLEGAYYELLSFALGYMYAEGKFVDAESAKDFVDGLVDGGQVTSANELWEKLQKEKLNAE